MDPALISGLLSTTQAGAIGSDKWTGRGERKLADKAAVEGMRKAFHEVAIRGTVVIGEGERDEAPMLYIGEQVGSGSGPEIDIAVDPLEGTNFCARAEGGAISVLAAAPKGALLHAPDTYMDKIAVGPRLKGKVDLDAPVEENLRAVASALGKPIEEVTVLVMDRERHAQLIARIRALGCRVKLIRDGDIVGAIAPALPDSGVDILLGIGAAPEGVIAAAALSCLGGDFQGRLKFEGQELLERADGDAAFLARARKEQAEFLARARKMGITDPDRKLLLHDLVKGDAVFVATGVTTGEMLRGVRHEDGQAITHSVVMDKDGMRFVEARSAH